METSTAEENKRETAAPQALYAPSAHSHRAGEIG